MTRSVLLIGVVFICGMLFSLILFIIFEVLSGFFYVWKYFLMRFYSLKSYFVFSIVMLLGIDCFEVFGGYNLCGNVIWVYYRRVEMFMR